MIFYRELLRLALPFPETLSHDWWLSLVAAAESTITYVPQHLVYHRQHTNNALGASPTTASTGLRSHSRVRWLERTARRHRERIRYLSSIERAAIQHPVSSRLRQRAAALRRIHTRFFQHWFSPYTAVLYCRFHRESSRTVPFWSLAVGALTAAFGIPDRTGRRTPRDMEESETPQ